MDTWLITGGCGFIGTRLVTCLRRRQPPVDIRVLDNLSVGTRTDLVATGAPAAVLTEGDIRDAAACRRACAGVHTVVHLAANTGVPQSLSDPVADMQANVEGTVNMLEAARAAGCRRFIFASSGAPVGEAVPPIHEELAPHPVSPYGASKLAGEGYCCAYFQSFGLETVSLRFGNVYGPGSGRKSSVVAAFIRRAMEGRPLEIYGDGEQTRDFIFVDDLVEAILKAAAAPGIGGETFQIASHSERTVNELAAVLNDVLEAAGVPPAGIVHEARRHGDVQRNYADTSKARTRLGWRPCTDLPEGLRRTATWFLEHSAPERLRCAAVRTSVGSPLPRPPD